MHRYDIADDDYDRIEPLLSGKPGDPGRNADDNRRFINAVLWIARTGAPWEDLPERYGKHNTVYKRFGRWAKKGRWKAIFGPPGRPAHRTATTEAEDSAPVSGAGVLLIRA